MRTPRKQGVRKKGKTLKEVVILSFLLSEPKYAPNLIFKGIDKYEMNTNKMRIYIFFSLKCYNVQLNIVDKSQMIERLLCF